MAKRPDPYLTDEENPELTAEDFAAMKPASALMPPDVFAALAETSNRRRGQRGPGRKPAKVPVTVNLDADVVATLKASGKGWQGRLRTIVRDAVTGQFLPPADHAASRRRRKVA